MRDVSEPRWVRVIALGAALALATFGAVGLLLADIGIYRPLLVLPIGLVAFVFLFRMARPLLDGDGDPTPRDPPTSSRTCAILAVALSAITAWWNATNSAQHVQINRDGGVYLNAGKWIATHGSFNLRPFPGPFAHNPLLGGISTGMKQQGDHLEFALSHMLAAVIAEAQNLGGNTLMFAAVPILGGFALLSFYLLANRLLGRPIAALGATATLAFVMPQISFSRDSTTEIPIQVLLFTAIWILCDRRTLRSPRLAFIAGLLLGLVQAMHIDGLAFIIGLPLVFAFTLLHTKRKARRKVGRGIVWAALGVIVGALLGAFDLVRWNRYYLNFVHGNLERLAAAVILTIAAAIVIVLIVRHTNVLPAIKRARPAAGYVVGVLVLIIGFGGWLVRPHIETFRAGNNAMVAYVQRLNHMQVDGTRRYAELSLRWVSWYIGPITLTLAIIGAAGLAVAFVRGSLKLPAQVATFMFAPPALVYLWRPSITPDQVWAARRFLPTVFPAAILLAFAAICAIRERPLRQAHVIPPLDRGRARARDRRLPDMEHPQGLADDRAARSVPGDHQHVPLHRSEGRGGDAPGGADGRVPERSPNAAFVLQRAGHDLVEARESGGAAHPRRRVAEARAHALRRRGPAADDQADPSPCDHSHHGPPHQPPSARDDADPAAEPVLPRVPPARDGRGPGSRLVRIAAGRTLIPLSGSPRRGLAG